MNRVIVHKRAAKYLKKLPYAMQNRIKETLRELAADPTSYSGVVQMSGNWAGYYRIRVGDVRIIYWPDAKNSVIYVDHIGPSGSVYKN